jgi:hypothetical protein
VDLQSGQRFLQQRDDRFGAEVGERPMQPPQRSADALSPLAPAASFTLAGRDSTGSSAALDWAAMKGSSGRPDLGTRAGLAPR